jgi:3-oxo-5-alpha-steroid 4-dehydrogenase 1
MGESTLTLVCYAWMAVAAVVFVAMFFITAPFGRHTSDRWGAMVNNKWGWFFMELPSFMIMTYYLLAGSRSLLPYSWILFACWLLHYGHRTFLYPLRIRATEKKMPLVIVLSGIGFNLVNAGLNGYYLAELAPAGKYGPEWLASWQFILGIAVFSVGMAINLKSDNLLIHLRKPGDTGYRIPSGFLFDQVSSPNLFGEVVEWSGFALMAWNLPALTFMVWTFANLVPRAKNHHDWYLRNFAEYPVSRKVIFPYIF